MLKYICENCDKVYEFKDLGPNQYDCEGYCSCKGTIVYQNEYLGSPVLTDSYVHKIKTVGQQADENVKRNGRAWAEEQLMKQKTKKRPMGDNAQKEMKLPKGATGKKQMTPTKIDKDLIQATPQELQRYVMTGQRPTPKNGITEKEAKKMKKEVAKEKAGKATKIISTGGS